MMFVKPVITTLQAIPAVSLGSYPHWRFSRKRKSSTERDGLKYAHNTAAIREQTAKLLSTIFT